MTISAGDYCGMNNKELNRYEAVDFHYESNSNSITKFRKLIPIEAEVVVDFRLAINSEWDEFLYQEQH